MFWSGALITRRWDAQPWYQVSLAFHFFITWNATIHVYTIFYIKVRVTWQIVLESWLVCMSIVTFWTWTWNRKYNCVTSNRVYLLITKLCSSNAFQRQFNFYFTAYMQFVHGVLLHSVTKKIFWSLSEDIVQTVHKANLKITRM